MTQVGYRGLRAWQLGMEVAKAVYEFAAKLPRDERYGLASQMKRAATSIPMNLAEGYGRGGREFPRFVGIAYGSLLELETAIELAVDLELTDDAPDIDPLISELARVLTGLRRSLDKTRGNERVRERSAEYGQSLLPSLS